MLTIGNYVKAKTPEEAYELNQARSSRIMGGMMWMRLSNARVKTLIDISGLGLDQIEETEDEIRIGAMCTLRQIEQSEAVKKLCGDGIEEAVRHIVGVQFRNQATVGGSIYGRFGFSDVLTAFLALDTYVELYDGGRICLAEFAKKKPDNDLLLFIVVKKKKRQFHPSDEDGFPCDRLFSVKRESERAGDMVFCGRRKTDEGRYDRKEMVCRKRCVFRENRGICGFGSGRI